MRVERRRGGLGSEWSVSDGSNSSGSGSGVYFFYDVICAIACMHAYFCQLSYYYLVDHNTTGEKQRHYVLG